MRGLVLGSLVAFSVITGAFSAHGQKHPQEITGSTKPLRSPDGRFELVWRRAEPNGPHEIWVRSSGKLTEQAFMYLFIRGASVVWSPDSTMVAITDRQSSDEARVRVFRIATPLAVEEKKEVAEFIEESFFREKDGSPIFGHSYARVVKWSRDSKSLLVELTAYDALDGSKRRLQQEARIMIPPAK